MNVKINRKGNIINKDSKNIFLYYMVPFTLGFFIIFLFSYYPFLKENKSFVWDRDGINQHYPSLVYYGRFLQNLIAGKDVPMIDFNVGMGFDVLTTLNYYAIGDPLTLLAVFIREGNGEEIYRLLIILRLYLSGASFLLYCINRKQRSCPSVLGAFIYVFCGYVFYAGVRHPYFTNPLIYLPLLFIGIEHILQKKKPWLFIIMTCISAISNFYFLYMLTILTVVYGIYRFFTTYDKSDTIPVWKVFFKTVFQAGFYYLVGIAMSAVVFLPVLYAFFHNGRFDTGYDVKLSHYSIRYYGNFISGFIAPNITAGFWTHTAYAAITPVIILILFRHKKYREQLLIFLIGTISLLVPFIGYLMNGFSYVSNRWEFGYGFLIAFLFTYVYEDLFHLSKTDKILLILGTLLYGVLVYLHYSVYVLYAFLILCLTVAFVLIFNRYKKKIYLKNMVISALIVINLALNGYLTYAAGFGDYVSHFIDAGKVESTIRSSAVSMTEHIRDDSFYRVEVYGDKLYNEGMLMGFRDVSGYFSIMDQRLSEFMLDLELKSQEASYRFGSMDYRSGLSSLACVKYLATSSKKAVPYGYHLVKKESLNKKRTYYLYENQLALPLGFRYESYITRDVYEHFNSIQKQEMLLQAAVLEEPVDFLTQMTADEINTGATGIRFFSEELPVTIRYGKGIAREGDHICVTEPGAKITVNFQGKGNSETYLRLENFDINKTDYYSFNVTIKGKNKFTKNIYSRSTRNNAYFGKDDYLINLGYQADPMKSCEIIFDKTGLFHLSNIQIFTLPMSQYEEQIKARKECVLQDIRLYNNRITGRYRSGKDSLLFLSIPYSKGWKAYVDGKKVKVVPAFVMYMALPVAAGDHEIELYYETPYKSTGIAVSAGGGILFLCTMIWQKTKKKKDG
ncbi:MAG: YfhO family protein [Lachnoclostridium sp.]